MTITITAFEASPDRGRGLARDTRVRWALKEAGQPYEVRLVSFGAMKEPAHLKLHPFGQIPTYEEGDLALFETGAIILHIAQHHAGLLPDDANARARAIAWMFAAINTVEPPILEFANAKLLEHDKPWAKERLPLVADRVRDRLKQLSARLGKAWTNFPTWRPMSPAARHGPPINGHSLRSWRISRRANGRPVEIRSWLLCRRREGSLRHELHEDHGAVGIAAIRGGGR
jgi:glutathione S-transferase